MIVNLNDVLTKAKNEKYAVGLFNTTDTTMLEAVIEAAEEENSPVIIGTAEVLLPYGELSLIAPSIVSMAKNASVPVVVHYDHGLTFDNCIKALKLGFSSVMYDCSTLSTQENINNILEMTKIAHAMGASIEGEIGHVGGVEGDANCDADNSVYTTVDEAVYYAKETGVDALAIAVGTAHGSYKKKPKLDFDRISDISNLVKTPLVLHGGSGLSDEDFKKSIKSGIAKINVFTDLCIAGEKAMKCCIDENKGYLDTRNTIKDYIKNEVKKKIQLFGSSNKV